MKNTDILSLLDKAERAAAGSPQPQQGQAGPQGRQSMAAPNMQTPAPAPMREQVPQNRPAGTAPAPRPQAHAQLQSAARPHPQGIGNAVPMGAPPSAPQHRGPMQRPPQAPPSAARSQGQQLPPQRPQAPQAQMPAPQHPGASPDQMRQGGTRQGAVQTKPAEAARAAAQLALSEAGGNPNRAEQLAPGQGQALAPANPNAVAKPQAATATVGPGSWQDQVPTAYGAVVSKGLVYIFGFLGLFALWAVLFPIDSAVVAAGQVISNGQNKLIQHPSGGVVREILVTDGQEVVKGDLLVRLDKSAAQGELTRLLARRETLMAQKSRFDAERNGLATFTMASKPAISLRGGTSISSGIDDETKTVIFKEQLKEFDAGRKRFAAQINTLKFQVETFRDQKTGMEARLIGGRKLLKLTNRELGKVRPLANAGYLPKARLWELEKTKLEQLTNAENIQSEMDATEQRISEAEAKLAELKQSDREKRSVELSKVVGEMAQISDSIKAAQIAVDLTELRAPVSGTIVKLAANTNGGVMSSGAVMAEIVPIGAGLQTEFRVPQNKAKHVYPGQKTRINITTFNRRTYDPIDGEVTYVSADSLKDETTGEVYFLARAIMKPNAEKNTGIDEVSSGMAAEVYVLAEPRVFASYLLQPIMDSFSRAFRESN